MGGIGDNNNGGKGPEVMGVPEGGLSVGIGSSEQAGSHITEFLNNFSEDVLTVAMSTEESEAPESVLERVPEILVIDDDPSNCRSIKRGFSCYIRKGEVLVVGRGTSLDSIVERVKALPPGSIVVTDFDYNVGSFNGIDLAEAVAAARSDIMIFMFSAGEGGSLRSQQGKSLRQAADFLLGEGQDGKKPVLGGFCWKGDTGTDIVQAVEDSYTKFLGNGK